MNREILDIGISIKNYTYEQMEQVTNYLRDHDGDGGFGFGFVDQQIPCDSTEEAMEIVNHLKNEFRVVFEDEGGESYYSIYTEEDRDWDETEEDEDE